MMLKMVITRHYNDGYDRGEGGGGREGEHERLEAVICHRITGVRALA